MWHIVPKFHQFHHIILDAAQDGYNPRYFHCFGDEDQIGKMLLLAHACHPVTVVTNTIALYWIGLVRRISNFVRDRAEFI